MTVHWWLFGTLASPLFLGSCGGRPVHEAADGATAAAPSETGVGKRRRDPTDDCEVVSGQARPEPTRIAYTGVAKAAACQRAVFTIMDDLTHSLGVACTHCHVEPDYAADTHNKQIANWMARELVARLQRRGVEGGRDVWCRDCHAGQPKLLGNPRRRDVAIEWMTTHLVEDFATTADKPPKCRDCHGGDWGSPDFRDKIILSELPGLPRPVEVAPDAAVPEPSER